MTLKRRWREVALALAGLAVAVLGAAAWWWSDDILRTALDPKTPYQTYRPPPAPDYARTDAWARLPADPAHAAPGDPPADVFFVHPTTYDGGRDWNAPIDEPESRRRLERVMLPNWLEPYRRAGRLFAPRYRQASLYAKLTLRDDALEARAFAYRDVRAAFDRYLRDWSGGRPLVIVGVGQGGLLASRLAAEAAGDPALRSRLVTVHLLQTAEPAARHGAGSPLPACAAPEAVGCVVAFAAASERDLRAGDRLLAKAAAWTADGRLEPLASRPALCVNPVTGSSARASAPEAAARGAANATGLEPGVRPAFLPGQVATRCEGSLLRHTEPRSPALKRSGDWAEGLRIAPFNLFALDLEADAVRRMAAWRRTRPPPRAAEG